MTVSVTGAARDREAFAQLYATYRADVMTYVHRRVPDYQLAEDITSETFLRAWRHFGDFAERDGGVPAWLQTIARNLVYDLPKYIHRRREVLDRYEDFGLAEDVADPAMDPADVVVALEANAMVRRVLDDLRLAILRLPHDDWRKAMLYRHVDGLSAAQTARLMGKTEVAVKAMCHRAMPKVVRSLKAGDAHE